MKMRLELEEKDMRILGMALGFLEGRMERESEEYIEKLLKDGELEEFFENKNEFLAAMRALSKRCAASVVRGA